jgi:hypothetical protein
MRHGHRPTRTVTEHTEELFKLALGENNYKDSDLSAKFKWEFKNKDPDFSASF